MYSNHVNSFWRVGTFIRNLMEFSFIWLACFSNLFRAPQCLLLSHYSLCVCFCLINLFVSLKWIISLNYGGLIRSKWHRFHELYINLGRVYAFRFCWSIFVGKEIVIFEFELKPWKLLLLSHPLWAFVIPYIFAFLLWEQLVDLPGLPLSLKVGLVIFLLSAI